MLLNWHDEDLVGFFRAGLSIFKLAPRNFGLLGCETKAQGPESEAPSAYRSRPNLRLVPSVDLRFDLRVYVWLRALVLAP